MSRVRSLLSELRRRRVFRAAGLYVVAAFGALQGADILVPALHLPERTMTFLVVLAVALFPVAMGLAWAFDLTRAGVQRTGSEPSTGASARSEPRVATPTSDGRASPPSVAVIPFQNLSADPDNDFFADGITEDVIANLSKIRALKVISRTSVMPFKKRGRSLREIGATLGATALVDGSVRRIGDRVRIVAQLVDADTDRHLWAETYDRDLTDIFAIQTDVALHIAAALEAELTVDERTRIGGEPTSDLRAYQLYLKGRYAFIDFTPEALRRAIGFYGRAIERDPSYALAHASLAMAVAELAEAGAIAPDVARRQATDAAREALRLEPGLGEAHCAMGYVHSLWEFDWPAAEAAFRRAVELCPNSADAWDLFGRLYSARERYDEALVMQRRAQELDPLAHRLDVASTLLRAGRYAEAAAEASRAVEVDPEHDRAHATLGWAHLKEGRVAEGLAEIERAVALAPDNTQWLAQLGQALALTGRPDDAREILRRLEERDASPYHLAFVHTGLGDHERAIDMLERAYEMRGGAIYGLRGSFLFAPLRTHPRFKALLARMRLV